MQDVCLVVPCFNEEQRLRVDDIRAFLHAFGNAAICFVDDGSSDGTLAVLEALRRAVPGATMIVHLASNQGKAEAVRQGVLHAAASRRFRLIGFWDADMSTPFAELIPMLDALACDPACGLAMGSRVRRLGSQIHRSALRHYLGRMFSTAASLLLHLPVYDSQCGAKVMRAEVADAIFADRFMTKWMFDVEILARLRNLLGPERVLTAVTEVPLRTWTEVGGSKLRLSHMARVPIELLRISRRYNRRSRAGWQHAAHPAAAAVASAPMPPPAQVAAVGAPEGMETLVRAAGPRAVPRP